MMRGDRCVPLTEDCLDMFEEVAWDQCKVDLQMRGAIDSVRCVMPNAIACDLLLRGLLEEGVADHHAVRNAKFVQQVSVQLWVVSSNRRRVDMRADDLMLHGELSKSLNTSSGPLQDSLRI